MARLSAIAVGLHGRTERSQWPSDEYRYWRGGGGLQRSAPTPPRRRARPPTPPPTPPPPPRPANKPGELARVCQVLANANVNLILSGTAHGDSGTAAFIADDEAAAREALRAEGIEFTERPALTIRMDNTPGSGAATFRKLADAGLNVDLFLPIRISDEQF